ncbi:hypothetical protein SeMB42_g03318 [Synchytrium endobioticum]|uniref:SCP domain-containing protein n=1 Tax=Synchytrium endobioticum TaxID=286115 RepID=A0A507D7Q3_9FUNG|nr:hypothetical protein SeLEV6574_g08350 [Synchytrium endobioticum]TPX47441.1 hypothetical protein SeMB42_g03318 [Synchytrium endobioticum]
MRLARILLLPSLVYICTALPSLVQSHPVVAPATDAFAQRGSQLRPRHEPHLHKRQNAPLLEYSYYNKPGEATYELLGTRYKRWQNLARTNPQGFMQYVSMYATIQFTSEALAFMLKLQPLRELVLTDGLQQSALALVMDEGSTGTFGHDDSKGRSANKRIASYAPTASIYGENLIAGPYTALDGLVALINDEGIDDRGHRLNIFHEHFDSVGIACGPHAVYTVICAFEFAADSG